MPAAEVRVADRPEMPRLRRIVLVRPAGVRDAVDRPADRRAESFGDAIDGGAQAAVLHRVAADAGAVPYVHLLGRRPPLGPGRRADVVDHTERWDVPDPVPRSAHPRGPLALLATAVELRVEAAGPEEGVGAHHLHRRQPVGVGLPVGWPITVEQE